MKLAASKSAAGQAVPDMVSVKRVSKSALQYSNFPRDILNEYRLRLSVSHEILSNIINDVCFHMDYLVRKLFSILKP